MWFRFWLQNLHFSAEVFFALVSFGAAWLFLDSYLLKRKRELVFRSVGFFLLSFALLLHATGLTGFLFLGVAWVTKILGLVLVLYGFVLEPIPVKPNNHGATPVKPRTAETQKKTVAALSITVPRGLLDLPQTLQRAVGDLLAVPGRLLAGLTSQSVQSFSSLLFAGLAAGLAFHCFRRVREGLQKELNLVFKAFLLFSASELLAAFYIFSSSSNIFLTNFTTTYGPIWVVEHLLKILAFAVLGWWVWGYLRFRLQAEIFILFVTSILAVFVFTTTAFTTLLLQNLQADALKKLETDVKVLEYAIDGLKNEALADARVVAENSGVRTALAGADAEKLFTLTSDFMFSMGTDFLIAVNPAAEVLARAEDKENVGQSLSNDPIVVTALQSGASSVTVATKEGVLAPEVSIRAAAPSNGQGAVITGFIIDNAFVDGVKGTTGLDVTVFGGDKRSATTLVAPDGKSRLIGTLEANEKITRKVLEEGELYLGQARIQNQPFYAVYSPLKDVEGKVLGMLFVGRPQLEILEAAQRTIQITFLISVGLMIASIVPAYLIARYVYEQMES